jgi:hypothetical protein
MSWLTRRTQIGHSVTTGPNGIVEADSYTCYHCNRVTFLKAFEHPDQLGARCTCCDKLICPSCVGKGCTPLQKRLEQMEARRTMWASEA